MSKETIKKVHLIYGIVLTALLVTLAILFAIYCIDINSEGKSSFSIQSISERFAKFSILAYITLAAIIAGGIINTVAPIEKGKLKGEINNGIILRRLFKKLTHISDEGSDKIERQRVIRFAMIIASLVFMLIASIGSFIYTIKTFDATNPSINGEIASGWLTILWFFIGPIVYLIVTAYVCKRSIKKELDIVKNELKNAKISEGVCEIDENLGTFTKLTNEINETVANAAKPKQWKKFASLALTSILLCVSVAFIFIGNIDDKENNIEINGFEDVLDKAQQICAECIGLG